MTTFSWSIERRPQPTDARNKSVDPKRFEARRDLGRIIELLRGVARPFDDEVVLQPSTDPTTDPQPAAPRPGSIFMGRPAIVAGRRRQCARGMAASETSTLVLTVKFLDRPASFGCSNRFDLPNLHTVGEETAGRNEDRLGARRQRGCADRALCLDPEPARRGRSSARFLPFMAIAFGGLRS